MFIDVSGEMFKVALRVGDGAWIIYMKIHVHPNLY